MTLLTKTATAALIATSVTVSCFAGHANAAPLSSPLALRDAIAPTVETVGWRGGGFRGGWGGGFRGGWGGRYGGWGGVGVGIAAGALIGGAIASSPYYGYNNGYYAPSYYSSYAPAYYDDEYAPAYYGGYSYVSRTIAAIGTRRGSMGAMVSATGTLSFGAGGER